MQDRRALLQTLALAAPGLALGRGPIDRPGAPHFQLGLAAYSFRDHFAWMKGKAKEPEGGRGIDMFGFIDYCAEHQVAGAELTSYFFPADADDAYYRRLRHHAHIRGVAICGTAIGNHFSGGPGDQLDAEIAAAKVWIDKAAVMGAPHVRFFAGKGSDFTEDPSRMDAAIGALQECADYGSERGVFVGVENHGNTSSDQMLALMDGVDSPWIGINLDTGNFNTEAPYDDLARCAPYAVNIQVKVMMRKPDGERYPADLERIAGILGDAGYQGYVVLEFEEKGAFEHVPGALEALRGALG